MPVGGGGAWPGFEPTRQAKLAARTASGRAGQAAAGDQAAARHDGARNTSSTTLLRWGESKRRPLFTPKNRRVDRHAPLQRHKI